MFLPFIGLICHEIRTGPIQKILITNADGEIITDSILFLIV